MKAIVVSLYELQLKIQKTIKGKSGKVITSVNVGE